MLVGSITAANAGTTGDGMVRSLLAVKVAEDSWLNHSLLSKHQFRNEKGTHFPNPQPL